MSEFNLIDLVEDAIIFAQKEGSPDIDYVCNYGGRPEVPVRADSNQLMQLFLNLIINARDAMAEGGTVEIGVQADSSPAAVADSGDDPCHAMHVTIRDCGIGIAPDDLDRVFKPFFTTKSWGSGLGLSMVRQVVENHRGTIKIDSEPGDGTTVTVTLPICLPEGRVLDAVPDGSEA
jgi:signal transduction histidine kinase